MAYSPYAGQYPPAQQGAYQTCSPNWPPGPTPQPWPGQGPYQHPPGPYSQPGAAAPYSYPTASTPPAAGQYASAGHPASPLYNSLQQGRPSLDSQSSSGLSYQGPLAPSYGAPAAQPYYPAPGPQTQQSGPYPLQTSGSYPPQGWCPPPPPYQQQGLRPPNAYQPAVQTSQTSGIYQQQPAYLLQPQVQPQHPPDPYSQSPPSPQGPYSSPSFSSYNTPTPSAPPYAAAGPTTYQLQSYGSLQEQPPLPGALPYPPAPCNLANAKPVKAAPPHPSPYPLPGAAPPQPYPPPRVAASDDCGGPVQGLAAQLSQALTLPSV